MAKILIVEDEKKIRDIIIDYLRKDGHNCIECEDGVDALNILKNNPVDLTILDIMIPHIDGLTVCKITRQITDIPIIILTAKSDEVDKLKGYELGADDYITKPFSPKILSYKVQALLKRVSTNLVTNGLVAGEITLMPSSRTVYVSDILVDLTYKEFELLHFFMLNKEHVFSREQLLNRIWGYDFEGNTRTIDTHVKTLRQKLGLGSRYIITLIRSGYKFEVKE